MICALFSRAESNDEKDSNNGSTLQERINKFQSFREPRSFEKILEMERRIEEEADKGKSQSCGFENAWQWDHIWYVNAALRA